MVIVKQNFAPSSEFVATFGLMSVIWGCSRLRSGAVPFAVASYITDALTGSPRQPRLQTGSDDRPMLVGYFRRDSTCWRSLYSSRRNFREPWPRLCYFDGWSRPCQHTRTKCWCLILI